jgi:exonuclease SbcD
MVIKLIHVSDIHFGSGESHGPINPATGLNVRFEDFVRAFEKVVDYTINNGCHVFLFSGDAYRNATPEPIYQKTFAGYLKRLSQAGIKTVLLVGNHDQVLKSGQSHALSVFQSLDIANVTVIDKPTMVKLDTAGGALQLIGLPHITRHHLMTHDKYASMSAAEIDRALVENVTSVLQGYYAEIDPELPCVLTAHMTVDRAVAGIEQELLVGYNLTYPVDILVNDRLDYVALGHVHKHQVIRPAGPAMVYAGSLERVDFGEEDEDKGFVEVDLQRGGTTFKFVSIEPRPFVTMEIDLAKSEDATADICRQIEKAIKPGCVLRIYYKLSQEQLNEVDEDKVRAAASEALSVKLYPQLTQTKRTTRIPQLTESAVSLPLAALETYLDEIAPDKKENLLAKAKLLIENLDEQLH